MEPMLKNKCMCQTFPHHTVYYHNDEGNRAGPMEVKKSGGACAKQPNSDRTLFGNSTLPNLENYGRPVAPWFRRPYRDVCFVAVT